MASLKDGIIVLKEIAAALREAQEENNAQKDYKEALRICLKLGGVLHCIKALNKLQSAKVEVMPEIPAGYKPGKVCRPMRDAGLFRAGDKGSSGAPALRKMLNICQGDDQ